MRPETLKRFAAPVPRYTSYPTAPHFSADVHADTYATWLAQVPEGTRASLYLHIPFCDELCWYCGCATKATKRYEPVARYVEVLLAEIALVRNAVPARDVGAQHIHFGGGSPSILEARDIGRIADALRSAFPLAAGAEFAVEVDPRTMPEDRIAAFAGAGVNRVSVGVQDFAEDVQAAINRIQSFATTRGVIEGFRRHGICNVNVDLVYGLPRQTLASLERTISQVLSLRPSRIALFGYAHLPERLVHQRLIPTDALPDTEQRFRQAELTSQMLIAAGYIRVGLDHFARAGDPMVEGQLKRNFQGYTSDEAPVMIALGASAIGKLPQGFVQNAPQTAEYERRIGGGRLATQRGHAMTGEDEMRALAIERLMCELHFPEAELRARYGTAAEPLIAEASALVANDTDGLVRPDPEEDGFRVTEEGRLFVRSICARFDGYLANSTARHSAGV